MENIEILVILCILLGLSNWFIIYQNYKFPKNNYEDTILDKLNKYIIELKNNNIILEKKLELKEKIVYESSNTQQLEKPPERKYAINFPTRGYPDNYQLMGILLKDNIETAYNLYGRQKYSGSNQYEYYVHAVIHNNSIKLPLNINKEIFDGQIINIIDSAHSHQHNKPSANEPNNIFKVKLYPYDIPRYIP